MVAGVEANSPSLSARNENHPSNRSKLARSERHVVTSGPTPIADGSPAFNGSMGRQEDTLTATQRRRAEQVAMGAVEDEHARSARHNWSCEERRS